MGNPKIWGFRGTLLLSVLILGVYVFVQAIVFFIFANRRIEGVPGDEVERLIQYLAQNGTMISLVTILGFAICTPLIFGAVKLKKSLDFKEYLGLKTVNKKQSLVMTSVRFLLAMIKENKSKKGEKSCAKWQQKVN